MTEADILKKFLGGPGKASMLWMPASIISAKVRILYSYTFFFFFFFFLSFYKNIGGKKKSPLQHLLYIIPLTRTRPGV